MSLGLDRPSPLISSLPNRFPRYGGQACPEICPEVSKYDPAEPDLT